MLCPTSLTSLTTRPTTFNLLSQSQNTLISTKSPFKNTTINVITNKSQLPTTSTLPSSSNNRRSRQLTQDTSEDPTYDGVLVVRRPLLDESKEEEENERSSSLSSSYTTTSRGIDIDAGLEEFAKKMPMFEPERVEAVGGGSSIEKPLMVNLDLALYKAKVLGRSFKYEEAEKILRKCINLWPEDGRAYVALGKILSKQSKTAEARAVYEKGCQATQGENPFIWQCWAVLEQKMGNIRRARGLFDAATVADKRHIAAWHGWAVLELKQGNVKKARQLLAKGLKLCGGNEYVYQTLALLEVKAGRYDQARYLFQQATKCNPRSCASWLAWAKLEMQQENTILSRQLFERAVQASPKNRFAWHVWGLFEASMGDIDKARKLLKIGHALNPKDPVLLQSLALLEYKHSTANLARLIFRRASELDPRHQPVWLAWGWMEWKEGNISRARELYQKVLSVDSTTECAARCLQAWGVLEQRAGNLSVARRLYRSSLSINPQSYVTWMTWAQLEEEQGNFVRAEEVRNLYFQQRTEVVDDASWVTGFMDIIDPALDSIKRLLKLDQDLYTKELDAVNKRSDSIETMDPESDRTGSGSKFDLDSFIQDRLSLDTTKLDIELPTAGGSQPWRRISRQQKRIDSTFAKSSS